MSLATYYNSMQQNLLGTLKLKRPLVTKRNTKSHIKTP